MPEWKTGALLTLIGYTGFMHLCHQSIERITMLLATAGFIVCEPSQHSLSAADFGASSAPNFVHHILDSDVYAFGADAGDRDLTGAAEIIACDRSTIYRYANGRRTIIDHFETPALLIHLRTADVDGDGDIDVVAADHQNGRILYYENPGDLAAKDERWPRHMVDDRVHGAHAVAIADLNRDGRSDIIASGEANASPPNTIFWYACPSHPNRAERWPRFAIGPNQSGGLAHYPGVGDVNKDGRPDVVHAAKNGQAQPAAEPPVKMGEWYRLWLQPDDPQQPWLLREIATNYVQATNIQVADVNGDEVPDLVATQGHHTGVLWFEGPDWKPHYLDRSLKSPHTLSVADFDRDEDVDVVTCAFESKVLVLFRNDGRGQFTRHDISLDQAAYDLVARDVDGDGDLDLIVAGQESRTVSWYEQAGSPRSIRVMTYNIHHGEGTDATLDLHRIAALIRRERADIVALQEVDRGVARTQQRDLAAELSELTGLTVLFAKNIDHQGGAYGNALLTRFPVLEHQNTHYRMWLSKEQRGLQQALIRVGGKPLLILNTHLDFQKDDRERVEHVDAILAAARRHPKVPAIVCGDFNDVPGSRTHQKMKEYFLDAWESAGTGPGFTVPVREPQRRIDYVFVSANSGFNLVKSWVPKSEASDHLPVVLELSIDGNSAEP